MDKKNRDADAKQYPQAKRSSSRNQLFHPSALQDYEKVTGSKAVAHFGEDVRFFPSLYILDTDPRPRY